MSTEQNIYAIKDRAPEFPCWVYSYMWFYVKSRGLWATEKNDTHWSPDAPEAPKGAPTPSPVAGLPTPETPEGDWALDVTVAEGKYTVRQHRAGNLFALRYGEPWQEMNGNNLVLALAQEIESLQSELDKITDTMSGSVNRHMERNAQMMNLRRDLAAARAEVEAQSNLVSDINASQQGWITKCADEIAVSADLRAQLATAKEERDDAVIKCANLDRIDKEIIEEHRDALIALRSDLAKANAAVEELALRHCNVARLFGIPFLNHDHAWISKEIETAISALRTPVPPEARAVEAEKILTDQLALPPDKRDWNEVHRAALSLRTGFPSGEGEEWATEAANAWFNGNEKDFPDLRDDLAALILKHAPRPTAARECGASAAVRFTGPDQFKRDVAWILSEEGNSVEKTVNAICELTERHKLTVIQHGLGVSEDTARLDWLEAHPFMNRGHPDATDPGFEFCVVANHRSHYASSLRAAIDAAMQQGGET